MTDADLDLADRPFDEVDEAILRELREVASRLDPCPADLTDRIGFALTVQALQAEVAELTSQAELVSRSSSPSPSLEPAEATTVTFSAAGMSIMIAASPAPDGRATIDGWLTAGPAEVELDMGEAGTRTVEADADGRFVIPDVPRGTAHLLVRPASGRPVITPQFTI